MFALVLAQVGRCAFFEWLKGDEGSRFKRLRLLICSRGVRNVAERCDFFGYGSLSWRCVGDVLCNLSCIPIGRVQIAQQLQLLRHDLELACVDLELLSNDPLNNALRLWITCLAWHGQLKCLCKNH